MGKTYKDSKFKFSNPSKRPRFADFGSRKKIRPFKFRVQHIEREEGGIFNGNFDTFIERA